MKQAILIAAGILGFAQSAVIVDREFNVKQLAEGIPLTVAYTLYNTFGSEVHNIEVTDLHFSNQDIFDTPEPVKFSFESLASSEKISKQFTVIPKEKEGGEHKFEASQFTYKREKNGETLKGVVTNKPAQAEIQTKRDFILGSSWHSEQWGVFGLLSIITIGLPMVMWNGSKNSRLRKIQQNDAATGEKKSASSNKKQKRQ